MQVSQEEVAEFLCRDLYFSTAAEYQRELQRDGRESPNLRKLLGDAIASSTRARSAALPAKATSSEYSRRLQERDEIIKSLRQENADLKRDLGRHAATPEEVTSSPDDSEQDDSERDDSLTEMLVHSLIGPYLTSEGLTRTAKIFADECKAVPKCSVSDLLKRFLESRKLDLSAISFDEEVSNELRQPNPMGAMQDRLNALQQAYDTLLVECKRLQHEVSSNKNGPVSINGILSLPKAFPLLSRKESVVPPPVTCQQAARGLQSRAPNGTNVKKVDEIDQQQLVRDAEEKRRLVSLVADSLQVIIPYVNGTNREVLLPLLVSVYRNHPMASARSTILDHIVNLIKRPDASQRRHLVNAFTSLANSVGKARTEMELLPACWEQSSSHIDERRIVAAEIVGALGPYVRWDIRGSMVLSVLTELAKDGSATVREAACTGLVSLLPSLTVPDKLAQVQEMIIALLSDESDAVIATSYSTSLPQFVTWSIRQEQLFNHVLPSLLSSLETCIQKWSDADRQSDPHHDQFTTPTPETPLKNRLIALLKMIDYCIPKLFGEPSHWHCTGHRNGLGQSESDYVMSISRWLSNTPTDQWPIALYWLAFECVPRLMEAACSVRCAPDSDIVFSLSEVLHTMCTAFGPPFARTVIQPSFLAAFGYPVADTRVYKQDDATPLPETGLDEQSQKARLRLLPVYLCAVCDTLEREEVTSLLTLVAMDMSLNRRGWLSDHMPALEATVRYLGRLDDPALAVLASLYELLVDPGVPVRMTSLHLFQTLIGVMDPTAVVKRVLPALMTLAGDSDRSVKLAAVSAFGTLVAHGIDREAIDKISLQFEAFLEEGAHDVTLQVLRTFADILPNCTALLRDSLIVSSLLSVSDRNAHDPSISLHMKRDVAAALIGAYRSLSSTNVSKEVVQRAVVTGLQVLLNDVAVDPIQKTLVENMIRDFNARTSRSDTPESVSVSTTPKGSLSLLSNTDSPRTGSSLSAATTSYRSSPDILVVRDWSSSGPSPAKAFFIKSINQMKRSFNTDKSLVVTV
mmetsp:Transcript_22531/g.37794  ORF Transcript_22531/g.37794 Transcript_22531/m.37794 type:complete len:1030 (+) Transcript_22531:130-3219(+)|eukprot:CAMPEP_0184332964 /NCGR_PEP_ID=MMETSP1089-20130417/2066_1 /TAXON_ID=38269 ORGANISM="Gloeochaete wittrockiana, Strain SAG46.84" /NCGR_SAMPLE_ID=MMETSP1089 /ASSEMBLY_ACC=CAM_ASM_000445 /LENGTH=1029 /DNA_ID=CAMNT_0026656569 /DNA_START=107 /DNA_END=3196 /DNA_ORIENTATION=+